MSDKPTDKQPVRKEVLTRTLLNHTIWTFDGYTVALAEHLERAVDQKLTKAELDAHVKSLRRFATAVWRFRRYLEAESEERE